MPWSEFGLARQSCQYGRLPCADQRSSASIARFAAAAPSGALVTPPARATQTFAPVFRLVTAQPPLEVRSFPIPVFWHRRNDTDPQIRRIRQPVKLTIRSVLRDICSPGGEAACMAGLADLIRSVRQTKPVTAFVNEMAASAAYSIASAASEIAISPTSILGSIGVVMLHADRSDELAAQGVKPTLTHSITPHAPETRHAGRAGPETGTLLDPSGSTLSVPRTN